MKRRTDKKNQHRNERLLRRGGLIPWQLFALWERARNEARRRQYVADLELARSREASRSICKTDGTTGPTTKATST